MKQMAKTWIGLVLIVILSVLSLSASAQVFRDDFDVLKEADWELWDDASDSVWRVKDGFLRVAIPSNDFFRPAGFFQFKGIPGNYETFEFFIEDLLIQRQEKKPGPEVFTIKVNNLGSKKASFGVAIGRRFPEVSKGYSFFYVFTTYGIEAKAYMWFGVDHWSDKEPRHPNVFREGIWALASMEIRFDRGHFLWFADGEKRADFEDPDFSQIELIGFLIRPGILDGGSGWVDSFTISYSGLAVSPQTKLATTWGTLKRF